MLLESTIEHELPQSMKMEVEAPLVRVKCLRVYGSLCTVVLFSQCMKSAIVAMCSCSIWLWRNWRCPGSTFQPRMPLMWCAVGSFAPNSASAVDCGVAGGDGAILPTSANVYVELRALQVYVDRLGSNVQVVRRNSNSCRRITLHGSDGSLRMFLVQNSQVR